MGLKLAQINAQRSSVASANLEIIMLERNIDVLYIQEPYAYRGKVRGFTSSNLRVTQSDCDTPWVVIISAEERVLILRISLEEIEHVMRVHVITETEEIYIINVYCQFSLPIEPFLEKLEKILDKIRGKNILIAMDSNAKSLTWNSKETDERGRIVEEFLIHNDLYVANKPCDVPTFASTQGESNIDLTIVSGNIIMAVQDWNVSNMCTTSDHNLILYNYCRFLSKRRILYRQHNFNIKKANWDKFEELVETSFNDEVLYKLGTLKCENAVQLFNTILEDVCSRSIPKKKNGIRTVPWWNSEIANLRKETKTAKRQFMRARKLNIADSIQHLARRLIGRAETNTFPQLGRARKNRGSNLSRKKGTRTHGVLYIKSSEKRRTPETACSLELPSGCTTMGWRETCALMEKAVPSNDLEQEDDRHKNIRDRIDIHLNCNVESSITEIEIDKAIQRLKNNKAPGIDKFHNEVLKFLWFKKGAAIFNLLNNCFREACFPSVWKIAELIFI